MNAAESYHPIQDAIEQIFSYGHVPRLQVDSRVATVPEKVRAKWQARLVIDRDVSWPLNLSWSVDGFEADLAFDGSVSRCVFPWRSVYVVLDRETGTGIVIDKHMPAAGIPPRPELDRVVYGGFAVMKGGAQRVHNPQADQRRLAFKVIRGGKQ